jgi:hypothetical protein
VGVGGEVFSPIRRSIEDTATSSSLNPGGVPFAHLRDSVSSAHDTLPAEGG